ncbi:sporulation peptidase YabG [Herbivorax sp. ANBcel31]|uniref:sporulation peptidase YabG n=1 Tax=Herbivorax sp. ANBcel31 TaxID=3069754 RepID=UPI0027B87C25|nr:sporulation peptidase YabG [Herbivorax sp. ANBcel31]MDQ2086043.1 sporulation peptidase YabG [Herbivorax sp. ANBcel31]
MTILKIGDIVSRKSYGSDILFKVVDIKRDGEKKIAVLNGLCFRLEADAPETDLIVRTEDYVKNYNEKMKRTVNLKVQNLDTPNRKLVKKKFYRNYWSRDEKKFEKPGKVLHIDGDKDYLAACLEQYKKFKIEAAGVYLKEKDQPHKVGELLKQYRPDILVLTGHDGVIKNDKNYSNINNYRNSKYYIQSVKEARKFDGDLDSLVIFAGACQSMYDKIIEAGANYASAPYRVLIHALDPVLICQKIAYTKIDKVVNPEEVISKTVTGVKGIGGVETKGKYRNGFPKEPYNKK